LGLSFRPAYSLQRHTFLWCEEKNAMTKIFWVTCPQCNGEFYCHYQELRHKKIKLLCPYCSHQFLDEESKKIVE
jgi:hypothetical protein